MSKPTFFFYDLETSGLSSSDDRIMQFAGQRTDTDLKEVGKPYNIIVKLNDDTLPSPSAILTTKITPQFTIENGIPEPELANILSTEIFTPDTITLGFNSVRFDDKFIQHLFWRNFFDPYEWQWREGRSRWDMLDVVRMTRALRPEEINWPITEDGKPTNRLELITKLNGITHESAHDALSDVTALIDVTRLIKEKQPKLFNYLLKMREKREVKSLVNLEKPTPFVYSSGRFGSKYNFTTVAFPLLPAKNGNILIFDLRYNLENLIEEANGEKNINLKTIYPIVKEFAYNKCPAVAPISVLDAKNGWEKISLSPEIVEKNLNSLKNHSKLINSLKKEYSKAEPIQPGIDPESSLYSSFIPDEDKIRLTAIRESDANSLADFHPNFIDERLPELLLHYKAKNFSTSLSENEAKKWEEYRRERLNRQAPIFLEELQKYQNDPKTNSDPNKIYLLNELYLWYESLSQVDY